MLGKLLKHEFKETAKPLIPLNLILIGITLLGSLFVATGLDDALTVLFIMFTAVYILSIFALFVVTSIYLTIRFYKTMFSAQGYLTHTLPASPGAILNAKILSSLAWMILTFIVCICSVLLFVSSIYGLPSASDFYSLQQEISIIFGIGFYPALCLMFLMLVITILYYLLMVYASLSIGQLFNQNRIPAAIGAGVAGYMIQQVVALVSLLILGVNMVGQRDLSQIAEMTDLYRSVVLLGITETFCFAVAYFIICHVIVKKKLNLE